VKEIEGKELAEEWCESWATYIKHYWMDIHAVICKPNALKRDRPTSFITAIT